MLPLDLDHSPLDEDGNPIYSSPSKTTLKRAMDALQTMGEELANLSTDQIKRITMPDNLREALLASHRIHAHGARKRQMQLIGKLMRSADTAPLQAALDEIKGVSVQAKVHQKRLEKLRDRIMAADSEFAQLAQDFPQADIQQLRQLRRNALKEIEHAKPPRAYRELFRQLRALVEGVSAEVSAGDTAIDGDDDDEK
jgi:ribosome-associated protein